MDINAYLKLFRRRWQIPFICLVLGAVAGWITTPADAGKPLDRYFRATHSLDYSPGFVDPSSGQPAVTPSELAYRVRVGEVPQQVAVELGTSTAVVKGSVSAQALADVNALAVTAIGEDREFVTGLADTAALILTQQANDAVRQEYQQQLLTLTSTRDALKQQRDDLTAQIEGASGDDLELLLAQRDAISSQYQTANQSLAAFAEQGEPTDVLTTAEAASPVFISEDEFNVRSQANKQAIAGQPVQLPPELTDIAASERPTVNSAVPAKARAIIGGFLGLMFGAFLVMGLDRFDTRIRSKADAENAFRLPVLAEVPPLSGAHKKRPELLVRTSPRSRYAEAYRGVRTSVLFVAASGADVGVGQDATPKVLGASGGPSGPRPWLREDRGEALTILVTSPGPEEGKTSSTANLAALMAEAGMRVLVVNCDYRRPRIHKYLEGMEVPSPDTASAVQVEAVHGARIIDTAVPGVRLVTGIGENDPDANPAEVVAAQRKVIDVARRHFDVILLDTAPILTTNDAVEILSEADLVLLTCRYGRTRRESASLCSELLERLSAPVAGVVFVESQDAPQAQYYYYYLDPSGEKRSRGGPEGDGPDAGSRGGRPENDGPDTGSGTATVTSLRDAAGS